MLFIVASTGLFATETEEENHTDSGNPATII